MLQFLKKTKTMHRISSRTSILNIPIKIYLQSSLSPSSNEVFFKTGTSDWTTGSSIKSVTLSQNPPDTCDMSELFLFFY